MGMAYMLSSITRSLASVFGEFSMGVKPVQAVRNGPNRHELH